MANRKRKDKKEIVPTVGAGIPVKKKVTLVEKAELLRQDLSLISLLDLFIELCRELKK